MPTRSEAFVASLARRSFLSLWSFPNPFRGPGKELCDLLVVCDPDVVICSVKEIVGKSNGDVAERRWYNRAVDASVRQISGAERWLSKASEIVYEGRQIPLPPVAARRVHRVAVALGGNGVTSIHSDDFGKGFVHVFDEATLNVAMQFLDTITDFVEYLHAKEVLLTSERALLAPSGEKDLVAVYLHAGRTFPGGTKDLFVIPGSWEELRTKPEFQAAQAANTVSRIWDGFIEIVSTDALNGRLIPGSTTERAEHALRLMARENRFSRRVLSQTWLEFHAAATRGEIRSRIVPGLSGTHYVFLSCGHEESREDRRKELLARCIIARGRPDCGTHVVGLATEHYRPDQGSSIDLYALSMVEWTPAHAERAAQLQSETGFFAAPRETRVDEDEYPTLS